MLKSNIKKRQNAICTIKHKIIVLQALWKEVYIGLKQTLININSLLESRLKKNKCNHI
jgi:hypothetical protein